MPNVKTILYCEDDPVIRLAYKNGLEQAGYHVMYAEDGLEGLKCLHRCVPDVVVLDLMMPKFSGEELLKFICDDVRYHEFPLIILSNNPQVEENYAELAARADRHLVKYHCTPAILLQAIQEIIAGVPEEKPETASEDSDSLTLERLKRLVGAGFSR
jgi:DNA-binding response OmpR family regulator